jgi:hypothetical protein
MSKAHVLKPTRLAGIPETVAALDFGAMRVYGLKETHGFVVQSIWRDGLK